MLILLHLLHGPQSLCPSVQVVHVCADHKKPKKLQRHLEQIKVRLICSI